ncbi:HAMP domain-containing sensor histidine kinase [Pseudomonas sp. EL_65y_Pfl2_R95]|uniref:HAMP domain-containing sensor histidine kinase n=1 Tax=Pseudomonas sp. EL_65y_Pfl2_R95 TaxID=3088698 RepID=UPI0030D98D9A
MNRVEHTTLLTHRKASDGDKSCVLGGIRSLSFRVLSLFTLALVVAHCLLWTAHENLNRLELNGSSLSLVLGLMLSIALITVCAWLTSRISTQPLRSIAQALHALDPANPSYRVEEGPVEVVEVTAAFNAMQNRVAEYMQHRVQILGSISHDLQAPITRMRLRAECMDDSVYRTKLCKDLSEVEHLVREGIDYARSVHLIEEVSCAIDVDAFIASIIFDYQDTAQRVYLAGKSNTLIDAKPIALRRVVVNLIDNALKYAGAAAVTLGVEDTLLSIKVQDRGPGIAEQVLNDVLKPFFRADEGENKSIRGNGLGLAIAQQLMATMGGSIALCNRKGGGLCVEVRLCCRS